MLKKYQMVKNRMVLEPVVVMTANFTDKFEKETSFVGFKGILTQFFPAGLEFHKASYDGVRVHFHVKNSLPSTINLKLQDYFTYPIASLGTLSMHK